MSAQDIVEYLFLIETLYFFQEPFRESLKYQ